MGMRMATTTAMLSRLRLEARLLGVEEEENSSIVGCDAGNMVLDSCESPIRVDILDCWLELVVQPVYGAWLSTGGVVNGCTVWRRGAVQRS